MNAAAGPLTHRQRQALRFIAEFTATQGWPPTLREIADGLGLASTSGAHWLLKQLEAKGRIVRAPRLPRHVHVVGSAAKVAVPVEDLRTLTGGMWWTATYAEALERVRVLLAEGGTQVGRESA